MSKPKQLKVTPLNQAPYFITEPLEGEPVLQTLYQVEKLLQKPQRVLLVGPAGSGKTYLAMNLAHRFDGEVHWFNGSSPALVSLQLLLHRENHPPGRVSLPQYGQELEEQWHKYPSKRLFIVDNCSDFTAWEMVLPSFTPWLIINQQELMVHGTSVFMPTLSDEHNSSTLASGPLLTSLLGQLNQIPALRPELEQYEQEKITCFPGTACARLLWRSLKIMTPNPWRETAEKFLTHLLLFAPDQPIFPAFMAHLFPHQAESEQKLLVELLEKIGILRPGTWVGGQPAWVIPSILPEILRQELPENEVREAVIQVVAAGREQLKLFFDGEEPPHLHHWVYHLHHLASLTYNTPVFDDKASLWGDLAYYHFLGDELDLATTYIQYALAIPHSWPDALATLYFYLGCIKEKQEQWPPAIEAFQEAFALLVYQARITAPNLADLDPAELTTYQLTMINKVLQHLGQVYYQQKDSHLTQTYFRRAAEVQQTLYQTPQAFRPLFELECYLALPLFDSEKLIWLQKIIQLKQTLTADWPILRMELVKDYQRLIELERKIPSTKTGQERVLKAYTQATQQSIEIYGVDSDETKEVVYQWYNWALELPIDQMRLSYKLLRKLLGPKALVVQALRVKIADKWFNFEG